MSEVREEMTPTVAEDVTTLCLCWKLLRADGAAFGVTEHDEAIALEDLTYVPSPGLKGGQFSQTADLRPGRASATGALSADFITRADLEAGLWDRTRIDVYRVDWRRPASGGVPVWSGYLGNISETASGGFEAELVSLKADFERSIGRVLSRRCDAALGDARCGVAEPPARSCDKRFETCRDVFANSRNFRGFPHMPGPDAVLAGPAASRAAGRDRT